MRILEKGDDLQLVLGLVDTGDVVEGDVGVGLDIDPGLALADLHESAAEAATHAPEKEHPDRGEEGDGNDP